MDFNKLLEPYNEGGLRTFGGQIKWLQRNGFSQDAIDYAITKVYSRLEEGETFQDGNILDQTLRNIAQEFQKMNFEEAYQKRFDLYEACRKPLISETVVYKSDEKFSNLSKLEKIWAVITSKV